MSEMPSSRTSRSKAIVVVVLAVLGCSPASSDDGHFELPPPPVARIADTLDTLRLHRAYGRAEDLPRLRSLLVQWKGDLVAEAYYAGTRPTTRVNIKSASKSLISALVGIAIEQGRIRDVDQTIADLLPAETRDLDSLRRSITVGNLLSMRAGLQSTSFENYGSWVSSRNWVREALARPMVAEPGGPMIYSTGSTHVLSAILTRATGMNTYLFAERHLARPLGIPLRPWLADPQGIYFGGNEMYLTPRSMVRVGELYLRRGRLDGRQILPEWWVDSTFVPRTSSRFNGHRYGYGWWSRRCTAWTYASRGGMAASSSSSCRTSCWSS